MGSNIRQITLHFSGDNKEILEHFESMCKQNFRSTEQEILFQLNSDVKSQKEFDKHVEELATIGKLDVQPTASEELPL